MSTPKSPLFAVLLASMLAGALSTGAQAPPAGQGASASDALQVTSRLVVLDVVVVDRKGNLVQNLDRSAFTVLENNAPQTIRSFEGSSEHSMPIASTGHVLVKSSADLARIGSAPVNVLVIDELNTPIMQIAHAQQSMRRFLEQQPETLPVPTLFLAAGASKITMLHDFTQSRADLIASVTTHVTDADFGAMINGLNGGTPGSEEGFSMTLGALSQIASSLRGKPGRKNVIWVGSGYANALDFTQLSQLDREHALAGVRLVTNRMLEARMTLYTLDPQGAMNPVVEDIGQKLDFLNGGQRVEDGDATAELSFEQFAKSTGGAVIKGRNDLDRILGLISKQATVYYTLSYSPSKTSAEDGRYKDVRVELKTPGLRALTRQGYYAGSDAVPAVAANTEKKQPQQIRFDLLSAGRTTLVYSGLHVYPARTATGYTLLVPATDLHWQQKDDGSRLADVTVLAVAFDGKNRELGQKAAQMKDMLSPEDKIIGSSRVRFDFPFTLPPMTTRVRVVLRDAATGYLGSANATP